MSLIYGTVNSVEGTCVIVLPFIEPGWATGRRGKRNNLPDFFLLIKSSAQAYMESGGGLSGCTFREMYGTHSQAFSTLVRLNRKPEGKRSGLIGSESIRLSKPRIP